MKGLKIFWSIEGKSIIFYLLMHCHTLLAHIKATRKVLIGHYNAQKERKRQIFIPYDLSHQSMMIDECKLLMG